MVSHLGEPRGCTLGLLFEHFLCRLECDVEAQSYGGDSVVKLTQVRRGTAFPDKNRTRSFSTVAQLADACRARAGQLRPMMSLSEKPRQLLEHGDELGGPRV